MDDPNSILFGDVAFLEQHGGIQKWKRLVTQYSRQCGRVWTDVIYSRICRALAKSTFYIKEKASGDFRLARETEIYERTKALFERGGIVSSNVGSGALHAFNFMCLETSNGAIASSWS